MSHRNPTADEWLTEIDLGLEYRRRFGIEELWGTFEAIYYNVDESMLCDGSNIFLSQGDAMLSTITVPSPNVRVRPVKPEEVDAAPAVQSLSNILMRETKLAEQIEIAALHAYLFGRAIIKYGYDSEWGYTPELDVGGSMQLGLTLTQLNSKGDRRIEYDSAISPGSPWCRAVDPRDFVVPWGTRDIESAPWVAHRVVRHIDDLKSDPKYKTSRLVPNMSMQDFVDSYRHSSKAQVRRMVSQKQDHVEFYEIHDRRSGRIKCVACGEARFLRDELNALQIENRLPFVSETFIPATRAFWVTPDVHYLFHIQNELSDTARQRTKQRRISTLKFLYDTDVISEEELQKLLSPDAGVAGKINAGGDITKAILKFDNVPNQALAAEEELLRANAREQLGQSRNQLGEYTGGRKTAREVATVDQSSKLRMSRRGVKIKRLYEECVRTQNGIVFQFWTLPRYVTILGDDQTEKWLRVNGPALRGQYAYNITFVDEADLESQGVQALQLYSMLSQDQSIDPIELRNFLANSVPDPSFRRLFNADVRSAMQQLPQVGRAPQSQGSNGRGASSQPGLPQLSQAQSQQTNQQPPTRLLAGGRNRP
jgi:hypothetical protein